MSEYENETNSVPEKAAAEKPATAAGPEASETPVIEEPIASEPGAEPSASREAWGQVVSSLDDLGKAVATWAKSMTDTRENRQRAVELKQTLQGFGKQIGDAVEDAAQSDIAQHLGKAATGTGEVIVDAARRFGEEVAPHLAGAFKSAADGVKSVAGSRREISAEDGIPSPDESSSDAPAPPDIVLSKEQPVAQEGSVATPEPPVEE